MFRASGASALLLVALVSAPAAAREWFVAAGGTGNGAAATPFGRIQSGLDAALPGDVVTVAAGTYAERLQTVRDGTAGSPITLRAAPGAPVLVTLLAQVLRVSHAWHVIEGLTVDGQYANEDLVIVDSAASGLVLRRVELRRATKDCVDMRAPTDVLIENSQIHHCLNAAGGRTDAHGVVAGAVRRLVLRGTDIHTVSGDALQLDPGRALPGWDEVRVEGCRLWLAPLAAAENGFDAGVVPGENAIDTKTNPAAPRARLQVTDTVAWGWRRGLLTNLAAFNLKENVDARLDRVTVYDTEIAFRTRGPGANGGAQVHVQNAVVYDVDTAVRYEDNIAVLEVDNTTLGRAVGQAFQAASSPATTAVVRNLLVLGTTLPPQATAASSRAVSAASFVSSGTDDYHLVASSPAVDTGATLSSVTTDRDGVARPQGAAFDLGAFEYCAAGCGTGGGAGGGTAGGAAGGAGGGIAGGTAGGGAAGGGAGGGQAGGAVGGGTGEPDGGSGGGGAEAARGCTCDTSTGALALLCASLLFSRAWRRRPTGSCDRA